MTIQDLASVITNSTVAVVVIAFFMYKDIKFMNTLNNTLKALEDSVTLIRNYFIEKEKGDDIENDEGK